MFFDAEGRLKSGLYQGYLVDDTPTDYLFRLRADSALTHQERAVIDCELCCRDVLPCPSAPPPNVFATASSRQRPTPEQARVLLQIAANADKLSARIRELCGGGGDR